MAEKKKLKKEKEEKKPETTDEVTAVEEKKEAAAFAPVIEDKAIAPADAFGKLSRKQVELIKRTVAVGASDDELRLFIQICKGANLNPFLRQAHLVPFWDSKNGGSERRVVVIGIDGFRAIAESTGQYAGNDDPVFEGEDEIDIIKWVDKKETTAKLTVPKKATVTVYKIVGGIRNPFTASARWSEYYPGGKKAARWNAMPYLMLGKCAEGLALRKAFPKQLSGMYEESEIAQNPEAEAQKRTASAFELLMKGAKDMTIVQLEDCKRKIENSDKYTAAQKKEFLKFANDRIEELQQPVVVKDNETAQA